MKRLVSLGLAMALALAMSSDAPQSQARASVAQAVMDRTAAGEEISVIVGVAARFVPEGNLAGDAAVADQRASIAQMLDDTMARAAAVGVLVGGKFDTIPYFAARVNRAQLEALATTAGVTSINEDLQVKPSLNVSTGMVNAPAAWAGGFTGTGWGVAVLDTGVETTHGFFTGRIASQACYSNALGLGSGTTSVCPGGVNSPTSGGGACAATTEGCDHGTHVAGIAAGANGPSGVNGVAPGAPIHAIQVFSQTTTGCNAPFTACTTAYTSDIIRALERVLALRNAGAQIAVVNMSLGGGRFFSEASCDASNAATKTAIDNLRSAGIASVIASGNDAFGDSMSAPGCISTAVAVGATTKGICTGPGAPANIGCPNNAVPGQISVPVFSNVAPFLDLYAPGSFIGSSVIGNTFGSKSGTSMATPHVAGAWAVVKQAAPAATVTQVLGAFQSTGTPITEPYTGLVHPMINVNAARLALQGVPPPPVGVPGAPTSFTATVSGNFLSMTWGAPVSGGAPTGYTLRARLTPTGAPIVNFPLGNTLAFGLNAPNGVYYLSVFATNAAGPGPESSVVPVTIPSLPPPPGAPTNLQANVVGNNVTFTFTPPASGGAVANFLLVAGQTPGFAAPLASLPLAPSQTTFGVAGVPPGTWYVRVVAQNAGGTSAPTNEVSFTVAGPTPPGAPTLNPAVVVGNTVSLSWAAGAGGAPTSYTLVAAASPGGTPFLSAPVGGGTSIAFGGVPTGTYFVRLLASNALGNSPPSNEITIVVP
jgi:subtilisin family serine protease